MTVTVRTPGLVLVEHEFTVPLDHARPDGETITVFARGARVWLTNEYDHNGLRADGERILGRLIDLASGRA